MHRASYIKQRSLTNGIKSKSVVIKVTQCEQFRIKDAAKNKGISVQDMFEQAIFEYMERNGL